MKTQLKQITLMNMSKRDITGPPISRVSRTRSIHIICHAYVISVKLTEAGSRVCLFYLEKLVPLPIKFFFASVYFVVWEVLVVAARRFLASWGTYVFVIQAYVTLYNIYVYILQNQALVRKKKQLKLLTSSDR